jgi:nucleoside-diphosphate-sugar epimerase
MRVFVAGATGVIGQHLVLRYGFLYGHGASDNMLDVVRKRQMPVIGRGTGIWSFCEVTDAAAATNEKAKQVLGWVPRYASWRDGFRDWAKTAGQAHAA